jgi:hypothetical protein
MKSERAPYDQVKERVEKSELLSDNKRFWNNKDLEEIMK